MLVTNERDIDDAPTRKIELRVKTTERETNKSVTIKLSQGGSERDLSKLSDFAKMEAKAVQTIKRAQKNSKMVTVPQKELLLPISMDDPKIS